MALDGSPLTSHTNIWDEHGYNLNRLLNMRGGDDRGDDRGDGGLVMRGRLAMRA